MLRLGSRLLILVTLGGLSSLSFVSAYAQTEEAAAPWRLAADEVPELIVPSSLDINAASLETLLEIPGLDLACAQAILDYRKAHGRIRDLDELQNAHAISDEIYEYLSPYVQALDETEYWRFRVLATAGFEDPVAAAIMRSPYRSGFKFELKKKETVRLGMALEKDAGEADWWDHSAFGLSYALPKQLGELFIGDYLLSFGEGILINTRRFNRFFGPGAGRPTRKSSEIVPYYGWDESAALRGCALRTDYARWQASAWASQRSRDAYVDSAGYVTAFDLSGNHQTMAAQSRENACAEAILGGRIGFSIIPDQLRIACTSYWASWDRPVRIESALYSQSSAGSIALEAASERVHGYLEVASDERGETAAMLQASAEISKSTASVVLYHAAEQYFSPLSAALDFDIGEFRDQRGALASYEMAMGQTNLAGAMHLHRRLTRTLDQTWGGQDLFCRLGQGFGHQTKLTLTSRWTQEEEATDTLQTSHWRSSCALEVRPSPDWRIQATFKFCRTNESSGEGQMLLLGIRRNIALLSFLSVNSEINIGMYDAPAFSQRLYWSDVFLDGRWQNRAFWGRGSFLSLGLRCDCGEMLKLEAIGFWDQPEEDSIRLPRRSLYLILSLRG